MKHVIYHKGKSESMPVNYGEAHPTYSGIVTDLAALPDGTYFHVTNGHWNGYIDTVGDKRFIWTGVSFEAEDPTQHYIKQMYLAPGDVYDAAISEVFVKENDKRVPLEHVVFEPLQLNTGDVMSVLHNMMAVCNTLYHWEDYMVTTITKMADENGKVDAEAMKKLVKEMFAKEN